VVLDPKKRLLYLSITAAGVIIAFISFYTPWVTVEGYGQSISLSLADAGRAGHGPYNLSIVATAVAMAGGIVFLFSKHLRRQYLLSAGTAVGIGAVVIIRNFVVNIDVGSLSKIPSVNAERGLGYWLYALSGILIAAGAILLSLLASKAPAVAAAPGPGGSPAPSYGPGRQPPARLPHRYYPFAQISLSSATFADQKHVHSRTTPVDDDLLAYCWVESSTIFMI